MKKISNISAINNHDQYLDELTSVFLNIHNIEQMKLFLKAILTPDELEQIKKRWQIVKLLLSGKTQRQVADILKISIAKVSRGSREIKYGNGVFQEIFKKIYN